MESDKELLEGVGHDESVPFRDRTRFRLAKKCPHPSTSVATLETEYQAELFLPALKQYVSMKLPSALKYTPSVHDDFDVFNQAVIVRPPNPWIASTGGIDHIHTNRFIPWRGRKPEVPARFDTALIANENRSHNQSGLSGLRAACVRAIFKLPDELRHPEPLVYVEWYTPFFQRKVGSTGMQSIKRSRDGHDAEIIPLSRIERACHLLPKSKRNAFDQLWTSSNVLDLADDFWLNWWISMDMWTSCCLPRMGDGHLRRVQDDIDRRAEEALAKRAKRPRGG